MQYRLSSILIPLFGLFAASACGGQVATSSEGKQPSCTDACAQAKECDSSVDEAECVDDCTKDDTVSRAGQEAIAKCYAQQDCEQANAVPTLACILNEMSDVELSPAGKAFCNETLERLNECQLQAPTGGQAPAPAPTSSEDCEDYVAVVADEFLTDLNECADKSTCQSVQTCFGITLLANVDLAALQNPKPGAPGLAGLLAGLFGGSIDLGGLPGGQPGGGGGPPPIEDGGAGGASPGPAPAN